MGIFCFPTQEFSTAVSLLKPLADLLSRDKEKKYESEKGFKDTIAYIYLNGGSLEIMSVMHFLMVVK